MKLELDFIVIGAQKAGTTSLFEYLRRHPEICLPAGKEVPYFSHDTAYATDWSEYLRKALPFADPSCKWGTVTPHYMVGGIYDAGQSSTAVAGDERTVPLRMHERLPGARLIAIIRDPVERARSHHMMAMLNGWDSRDFGRAVADLLEAEALVAARRLPEETTGYVVWGEYGRILGGYLDVFPSDQLLVLYSAELKADPAGVLRRVFEFLDVAPDFLPDNLGTAYRPSGASRRFSRLDLNVLQAAAAGNPLARGLWHALPEPTRRRIDRRFNRANYLADLWNRCTQRATDPGESESVPALREHYREDAERLAMLLGAPPPWARAVRVT